MLDKFAKCCLVLLVTTSTLLTLGCGSGDQQSPEAEMTRQEALEREAERARAASETISTGSEDSP